MTYWQSLALFGLCGVALTLGIERSNRLHRNDPIPAERIHFDRLDLANTGDASAYLPNCKTVETDDGRCIAAGTYEGDPVLLFGRKPYLHVIVDVDMHGATIDVWNCDGGLCGYDLPTTMATITVHSPEP